VTELHLSFAEISEADIPELTEVMTRAFDDDAQKHLGAEKGGPPGYDDGEFFHTWLFGYEWTFGYKAVDDHIVGAVIVWIFDTGRNIMGTIFVDPKYQNRGVGQRIWEFIESTYPETESRQLETPSFAIKNHHFYEKCGFQKIEEKPPADDMPYESWVYRKSIVPG